MTTDEAAHILAVNADTIDDLEELLGLDNGWTIADLEHAAEVLDGEDEDDEDDDTFDREANTERRLCGAVNDAKGFLDFIGRLSTSAATRTVRLICATFYGVFKLGIRVLSALLLPFRHDTEQPPRIQACIARRLRTRSTPALRRPARRAAFASSRSNDMANFHAFCDANAEHRRPVL